MFSANSIGSSKRHPVASTSAILLPASSSYCSMGSLLKIYNSVSIALLFCGFKFVSLPLPNRGAGPRTIRHLLRQLHPLSALQLGRLGVLVFRGAACSRLFWRVLALHWLRLASQHHTKH